MAKRLSVILFDDKSDFMYDGETALVFSNGEIYSSMVFGGEYGMQRDSITLDELRTVFNQLGIDE
jgi:hypothetical protein